MCHLGSDPGNQFTWLGDCLQQTLCRAGSFEAVAAMPIVSTPMVRQPSIKSASLMSLAAPFIESLFLVAPYSGTQETDQVSSQAVKEQFLPILPL
jgi:hypothetical protein